MNLHFLDQSTIARLLVQSNIPRAIRMIQFPSGHGRVQWTLYIAWRVGTYLSLVGTWSMSHNKIPVLLLSVDLK